MGPPVRWALALGLLGGAVVLRPPPPPAEVVSDAPVCVRVLPSGAVLEGPEVCLPSAPVPESPDEPAP